MGWHHCPCQCPCRFSQRPCRSCQLYRQTHTTAHMDSPIGRRDGVWERKSGAAAFMARAAPIREVDVRPSAPPRLLMIAIWIRQLDGWVECAEEGLVLPQCRQGLPTCCWRLRLIEGQLRWRCDLGADA